MTDIRLVGLETVEPYRLGVGSDLYSMPEPPMLIEGILPKQTITGLTSYPGTGKTWLAFEFIRALATGGKFLKHFQSQIGSCLFVGSDASIYDYARQWRKLTMWEWSQLNLNATEGSPDYTNPLDENVRFLFGSDFMLDDINTVRRIIRTNHNFLWGDLLESNEEVIINHGFSLIVFDTLSKLTRADQNSNTQMEEVFRNIRFIAEQTKASILLLHHNAKATEYNDGEDWRGAVGQIAALDNWFNLKKDPHNENARVLQVKRFRGLTPEPFGYSMSIDEDSAHLDHAISVEHTSIYVGIQNDIVQFLNKEGMVGGWFTVRQISTALYESHKILFPDFEAFVRCVRNRLNYLTNSPVPLVRRNSGNRQHNRAEFTAIIQQEESDERTVSLP